MIQESGRDFSFRISKTQAGERIDTYLAFQVKELTRSRIQDLIKAGYVTVNGRTGKASYALKSGDRVDLTIPPPRSSRLEPEPIDFDILYEDAALLVVNKPAGLVVHPAPGHATGTLVHGLLEHCRDLSGIGGVTRPGIVHRLDKDTSGLLVVAKNDRVHEHLSRQFKDGRVQKEYVVLVHGSPRQDEGRIDLPIGRHPKNRKRMAVVATSGRGALTLWRVEERYERLFARLRIQLKTGRTHQIRVHLSHIGHPVIGDPVYGPKRKWWKAQFPGLDGIRAFLGRQMLHARCLGFVHPETGEFRRFEATVPMDMTQVMEALQGLNEGEKIP
ncbi:MAG: RluA family pseudouridine synthase [Desulfobacteraceae bacterium]